MQEKKEFTCIVCPVGCQLLVEKKNDDYIVAGNSCKRGAVYGKQEMISPKRNISSTVRVKNGFLKLVPVKTSGGIPKEKIFDVMKEINKIEIEAPVKMGQLIIENVLETGSAIVACRDIGRV